MARTAPVPNIPAIPGMNPGAFVMGGGGGSGGGSGQDGDGQGGEQGADGDASGDGAGGCAEGDPVCPITGRMFLEFFDMGFAGPLPLRWVRFYNSRESHQAADIGCGWTHSFGWRIRERRRSVEVFDDRNRLQRFPRSRDGKRVSNNLGWHLKVGARRAYLTIPSDSRTFRFGPICDDGFRYLIQVEDPLGNRIQIHRNAHGHIEGLTDSAGRPYRVRSDSGGRIESISVARDPAHSTWMKVVSYTYDDQNNLAAAQDPEGFTSSYRYDHHLMTAHRSPSGLTYFYRYDGGSERSYCVETWGEYPGQIDPALDQPIPTIAGALAGTEKDRRGVKGIHYAKLTYDKGGAYCEASNGLGLTRYFGDASGRGVKIIDAAGGVTTSTFDGQTGALSMITDPAGRTREINTDGAGNAAAWADAAGRGIRRELDLSGDEIETNDASGAVVRRRYNDADLLVFIAHADDTTEDWTYDECGLLQRWVDRQGRTTTYVHDAMGNCTEVHFNGGVESTEYDYLGRPLRHVDATGGETLWRFDQRSEIVYKRLPDGVEIHVQRDANRNVTRLKVGAEVTRFEYGGMGWLCQRVEPGGRTLDYRYDIQGNLVRVRNGRGQEFTLRYDAAGRPEGLVTWEGREVDVSHNLAGEQLSLSNELGQHLIEYDEVGRIVAFTLPDQDLAFEHDWAGFRRADNGTITLERDVDGCGRVTRERQGDYESEVRWHGGKVSAVVSSSGLPLNMRRGPAGYLEEIAVGSVRIIPDVPPAMAEAAGETHVDVSRNERVSYLGDHLIVRRGYDDAGRMTSQCLARFDAAVPFSVAGGMDDPNLLGWSRYGYDNHHRLVSIHRSNDDDEEFILNAAGQVEKHVRYGGGKVSWSEEIGYDAGRSPRMPGATYDALFRPVAFRGEKFSYDSTGRLFERLSDKGVWRYHYNALDQLIRVEAPPPDGRASRVIEMEYDVHGRRMRKRVLEDRAIIKSTAYVWTGDTLLHELDELGGATRTYFRNPDHWSYLGHVDQVDGAETATFYLLSASGGVERAVDEHGQEVWSASVAAYGEATLETEKVEVTARFVNQFYDPDIELTYNRRRWYDSRLGLYVSADPWLLDGSVNPRDYVDNPNDYADPTGLMPHPGIGDGTGAGDFHASPTSPAASHPGTTCPGSLTGNYLSGPGHWSNDAAPGGTGVPGYAPCPTTALSRGSGFGSAQGIVDTAGATYGCHSCGAENSGYSDPNHWTCDHQPPRTTYSASTASRASDTSASSRASSSTVRLYPHCKNCSRRQGGVLSHVDVNDRVDAGVATMDAY